MFCGFFFPISCFCSVLFFSPAMNLATIKENKVSWFFLTLKCPNSLILAIVQVLKQTTLSWVGRYVWKMLSLSCSMSFIFVRICCHGSLFHLFSQMSTFFMFFETLLLTKRHGVLFKFLSLSELFYSRCLEHVFWYNWFSQLLLIFGILYTLKKKKNTFSDQIFAWFCSNLVFFS